MAEMELEILTLSFHHLAGDMLQRSEVLLQLRLQCPVRFVCVERAGVTGGYLQGLQI